MQSNEGNGHVRDRGQAKRRLVVASDLDDKALLALGEHFGPDPHVEVIEERRWRERRCSDRRAGGSLNGEEERRAIVAVGGLRVADRRMSVASSNGLALPPALARYAESVTLVKPVMPAKRTLWEIEGTRLALRAQGGDKEAGEGLYPHYHPGLVLWLRQRSADWHEAEDLAHDAYLKASERLAQWGREDGAGFGAWLLGIAKNELGMYLRRAERIEVKEPEEVVALAEARQAQELDPNDDGNLDRDLDLGWVDNVDLATLMTELPAEQHAVLTLRFHLDSTLAQIAEELGKSEDAAKMQLHRALRTLERLLSRKSAHDLRMRRQPMSQRVRRMIVIRGRRFAMTESPGEALLRERPQSVSVRNW